MARTSFNFSPAKSISSNNKDEGTFFSDVTGWRIKGILSSIDLTPSIANDNDCFVVSGMIITFTKVFAVSFKIEIVSSSFFKSCE